MRGEGHEDDNWGLNIIKITLAATITVMITMRQGHIMEYIRSTCDDVMLTVNGNALDGLATPSKLPSAPLN